jgi:hypothetical protein
MISLAPSSPREDLFFVWVTLNEQKWISFAERLGASEEMLLAVLQLSRQGVQHFNYMLG